MLQPLVQGGAIKRSTLSEAITTVGGTQFQDKMSIVLDRGIWLVTAMVNLYNNTIDGKYINIGYGGGVGGTTIFESTKSQIYTTFPAIIEVTSATQTIYLSVYTPTAATIGSVSKLEAIRISS